MNADEVATITGTAGTSGGGPAQAAEALAAIARELLPGTENATELATAIGELKVASERQVQAVSENTDAVAQNTVTRADGGQSTLAAVGNKASSFFSSAFGIAPLISGLISLFGGGGSEPEQVVLPYVTRPEPIRIESAWSSPAEPAAGGPPVRPPNATQWAGAAVERPAPAQVTINIQAMDSRSFLDHSDDIARAVRSAMLNSNSLNDVVNEL